MPSERSLTSTRIDLNPNVIFRWVLLAIGLLLAAHIAVTYLLYGAGSRRGRVFLALFDLDMEQSFGTWFSSILLLGIGVCLLWIASLVADQVNHWRWLGRIVIVLSCDEVAALHDRFWVIRIWADRAGVQLGPVFHFAWTLLALVLLAMMLALYARFLWRLPAAHRNRLVAAAVCYFGGAVGMEMLGSSVAGVEGTETGVYLCIVAIEETMEMVGLALGLRAVLTILADRNAEAELRATEALDMVAA